MQQETGFQQEMRQNQVEGISSRLLQSNFMQRSHWFLLDFLEKFTVVDFMTRQLRKYLWMLS